MAEGERPRQINGFASSTSHNAAYGDLLVIRLRRNKGRGYHLWDGCDVDCWRLLTTPEIADVDGDALVALALLLGFAVGVGQEFCFENWGEFVLLEEFASAGPIGFVEEAEGEFADLRCDLVGLTFAAAGEFVTGLEWHITRVSLRAHRATSAMARSASVCG